VKLLPDGQPVQLTHDSFAKMVPAFSPDGSRVAYSARRPDAHDWEIWEASVLPGGGEPRQMLSNAEGLTWIDKTHPVFGRAAPPSVMAVVTSTESRTASRDVYVPRNANGMAHFSALSPDRKQVLIVEMQPGSEFGPCRLAPFDGSSKGRQVGAGARPLHRRGVVARWEMDVFFRPARERQVSPLAAKNGRPASPSRLPRGLPQEEGLAITRRWPVRHYFRGRRSNCRCGSMMQTASVRSPAKATLNLHSSRRMARKFTTSAGADLWATELASGHAERVCPAWPSQDMPCRRMVKPSRTRPPTVACGMASWIGEPRPTCLPRADTDHNSAVPVTFFSASLRTRRSIASTLTVRESMKSSGTQGSTFRLHFYPRTRNGPHVLSTAAQRLLIPATEGGPSRYVKDAMSVGAETANSFGLRYVL
jgi:hypothetical protein